MSGLLALYTMLPVFRSGTIRTVALPATWLSPFTLVLATSGSTAASYCMAKVNHRLLSCTYERAPRMMIAITTHCGHQYGISISIISLILTLHS